MATTKKTDADKATPAKSADLKKPGKATTAVAVRPAMNVVSIQEQLKAQTAAMANRTAPAAGNKIKPGKGKFALPDGTECTELHAVIVDFCTTHNLYEGKFDPKNIQPPICFARGANPKDMVPSANAPQKQSVDCQVCPMNQFGSDGDGKACKNGRKLVLLPTNEAGDDVDHEADLLVLEVSPTALKGFDGYVQSVVRTFQMPPIGVITTITLDDSVDYAKLVFTDPRPIASLGEAMARQAEAQEILAAEPDLTPRAAAAPAAKTAARRPVAGARR
jgi:hypothetical protein